jgi:hypothetical protein
MVGGVLTPLTQAEEDFRDAEEAAWEAERPARKIAELRIKRNIKLVETDWTQSPDSPMTDETKDDWKTYRQALRDLPANTADPTNITWPEEPGA